MALLRTCKDPDRGSPSGRGLLETLRPFASPFGAILIAALFGGCPAAAPPPPPIHEGPIVLITIDALRADALGSLGGRPGLAPHLDAFAASATWAGSGVTSSSWTVPSMASLFTGLQPWSHGNTHGRSTVLADELTTLPEALSELGYATQGYRSNHWLKRKFGYHQGFDTFRNLGEGRRAENALKALDGGRSFIWVHILPPHAPYIRRAALDPQVVEKQTAETLEIEALETAVLETLPPRLRPLDLEPYFDPAQDLPPELEAQARTLYAYNVAFADGIFGRLMAALEASGQAEKALVVVTSDHGEEFGENHQVLHGGNLHRVLLEVPLLIRLPKGLGRELALEPGSRPANLRLAATLLDAAGGQPPESLAPSLFVESKEPALSELYLGNGVNTFSLLEASEEGPRQLVWESSFSPPEDDYYRIRLEELGATVSPPLAEDPQVLLDRQARRYAHSLPLSGVASKPRLRLWRWTATPGEAEELLGEETLQQAARRLRQRWIGLNGPEALPPSDAAAPALTAEDKAEMRSLGYVQ